MIPACLSFGIANAVHLSTWPQSPCSASVILLHFFEKGMGGGNHLMAFFYLAKRALELIKRRFPKSLCSECNIPRFSDFASAISNTGFMLGNGLSQTIKHSGGAIIHTKHITVTGYWT